MSASSTARTTTNFLDLSGDFHLALDRLESRLNAVRDANSDEARATAVAASLDFLVRSPYLRPFYFTYILLF
jgi:hypothetical protein